MYFLALLVSLGQFVSDIGMFNSIVKNGYISMFKILFTVQTKYSSSHRNLLEQTTKPLLATQQGFHCFVLTTGALSMEPQVKPN